MCLIMEITPDIYVKLQHIEDQIGRLVSDAESEKHTRKERNSDIDKRLLVLEKDKIKKDYLFWIALGAGYILRLLIEKMFK